MTILPLKILFCVNCMLLKGLQNDTNLQHNFLHMGSTPPLTQCVKKHPIWQMMASLIFPPQVSQFLLKLPVSTSGHLPTEVQDTHRVVLGGHTTEAFSCHGDWSCRLMVCILLMPTICMNYLHSTWQRDQAQLRKHFWFEEKSFCAGSYKPVDLSGPRQGDILQRNCLSSSSLRHRSTRPRPLQCECSR